MPREAMSKVGLEVMIPSPLQVLDDDRLARHAVKLYLKRADLIHPYVPGNKWRKLKYNLQRAWDEGHRCLLTFGGAYSNHIRATAAAGHYYGFSTIGVIRGEEHLPLNKVLTDAVRFGMQLVYMDRATYRRKASPEVEAACGPATGAPSDRVFRCQGRQFFAPEREAAPSGAIHDKLVDRDRLPLWWVRTEEH